MTRLRAFLKLIAPFVALFLVLAAVMLLRLHYWTAGVACLLVAMALLIAGVRFPERFATGPEETQMFRLAWRPALLWFIVIWLNGVAIVQVLATSGGNPRLASAAWVGSVLIALLIVWLTRSQPGRLRRVLDRIARNRGELALLLAVLLVAATVRTVSLAAHPYPWSGDEASVSREATRIISGEKKQLFDTGWSGQPNWSFVPTAAMQYFLGNGIFATRLTSALMGVVAVIALYLVARELFGGVIALMSAAFLATLPYHVHFSRLGFHNIVDSLSSSVMVWLVVKAVKTNDPRYYYTAGAAAGLGLYSYPGTRLALGLAVVALVYFLYRERAGDGRRGLHGLIFLAGALVSAAPQAAFFASHPQHFLTRLGQESILLNGWLWQHAADRGVSIARVLFD